MVFSVGIDGPEVSPWEETGDPERNALVSGCEHSG